MPQDVILRSAVFCDIPVVLITCKYFICNLNTIIYFVVVLGIICCG